ncbi:hypothetical protein E2F51_06560 [Erwinia sp. QL-Z3]|nr:hypothetical protein E2F51_06560 [Erwinia sp. QL-Z3]
MLSPPRLPALCITFNATACTGSGRASTGPVCASDPHYLHANPCSSCMHHYLYSSPCRKSLALRKKKSPPDGRE